MNDIYPHTQIAALRAQDYTWHEVAGRLGQGATAKQLRQAHSGWLKRQRDDEKIETHPGGGVVVQKWLRTEEGTIHVKNAAVAENVADAQLQAFEELFERGAEMRADITPPPMAVPTGGSLAVLSIYDAHFGMKVDGNEVDGESQDLRIISEDFVNTASQLVSMSRIYDIERYCIPLGHDFSHVNQYDGKSLTTRAGTQQDTDSRLWKIHQAVCQAAITMIDKARSTGKPVDVVMVPGNHDPDENFKLGEFLRAYYRHDELVDITNTPTMNKYYGWESNAFCLTHGEHYMKKNGQSPILTFAAECPPDIWARGHQGGRYVLSGHLHARRAGQYTPTSDVTEEKGIVTYVLPGLTATDDWHYRSGYRHSRAGTLQVFRREGGLVGHHEVTP